MKKKNLMYIKFALDIIMAVTFVLFFNKRVLGGLTFHEIAGLVIAVIFFTHILLNWKWVKNVTKKLFNRSLPTKTRISYLLNLLLLLSMAFIIISGIFISRVVFPNIDIGNEQWFKISHMTISFLVLIIVAVHIGLHWKWIMNVFKKIIHFNTPKPVFSVLAKIVTITILVFGVYQMYSTQFIMQLQRVASVVTFSSDMPQNDFKEKLNLSEGEVENGEIPTLPQRDFEGTEQPTPPQGEMRRGEHPFAEGENNFKERDGHGESANPLGVITTYLGIMAVFIIVIYYIEKIIIHFKRKNKKLVDNVQ